MGLTRSDVEDILTSVTYKPGWTFELYDTEAQGTWLCVHADVENSYHPGETVPLHIRSPLPPCADEDAFLAWLRWRLERIEIHECHEWLKRDGKPMWDPHADGADQPRKE
jgi:hypothetical protein